MTILGLHGGHGHSKCILRCDCRRSQNAIAVPPFPSSVVDTIIVIVGDFTLICDRPYDDQTSITISLETQAKLAIQELIKLGKYDLVSSEALEYEVDASPYSSQAQIIRGFIQENASIYVGPGRKDDVDKQAEEITEAEGIR